MTILSPHRRAFLKLFGHLGLVGLVAPAALSGCGGRDEPEPQAESEPLPTPAAKSDTPAADTTTHPCSDVSGLSADDLALRESYEYVDVSEDEELICQTCEFWDPPVDDEECGGCQLFAGPVRDEGWCNAWSG